MSVKNHYGMSLISIMIASAMMAGLAVVGLKLTDNINLGKKLAGSSADEFELSISARMLLNNPNFCKVSLEGMTFEKSDIDFSNNLIDETINFSSTDEGLDIELWYSNPAGDTRTHKKYNGADNPGSNDKSKYGNLDINTLKLVMNNGAGPCTGNYCEGTVSDVGQIILVYEKKLKAGVSRTSKKAFDVVVNITTDSSGISTINDCSLSGGTNAALGSTEIVLHSQSSTIPACPSGWTSVKTGYSFMGALLGGNYESSQALGDPGSCLEVFGSLPIIECENNRCDYHTSGDYSYWLKGSGSSSSRCSVCRRDDGIKVVLHSQSSTIPSCPAGLSAAWTGYSFLMASIGDGSNAKQSLSDTGSCLGDVKNGVPTIECTVSGCSSVTGGDYSMWLTTRVGLSDVGHAFPPANVARCAVCVN